MGSRTRAYCGNNSRRTGHVVRGFKVILRRLEAVHNFRAERDTTKLGVRHVKGDFPTTHSIGQKSGTFFIGIVEHIQASSITSIVFDNTFTDLEDKNS